MINFSTFLSSSQNNNKSSSQSASFIAPPVLNSFPQATSSANIVISGLASKNQMINLYLNDNLINSSKSGDDGKFIFKTTIKAGYNTIYAKVYVDGKESESSNIINTAFKSAPPSLNIDTPSDGQSFSKDQNIVEIKGTTDIDVKVTVNGFWAITDNSGNYSYNLLLQNGENKVVVIATDTAGNKAEKDIKVNYSP
jgi:bacillopeptidase F